MSKWCTFHLLWCVHVLTFSGNLAVNVVCSCRVVWTFVPTVSKGRWYLASHPGLLIVTSGTNVWWDLVNSSHEVTYLDMRGMCGGVAHSHNDHKVFFALTYAWERNQSQPWMHSTATEWTVLVSQVQKATPQLHRSSKPGNTATFSTSFQASDSKCMEWCFHTIISLVCNSK